MYVVNDPYRAMLMSLKQRGIKLASINTLPQPLLPMHVHVCIHGVIILGHPIAGLIYHRLGPNRSYPLVFNYLIWDKMDEIMAKLFINNL